MCSTSEGLQCDGAGLHGRRVVASHLVAVVEPSLVVAVDRHAVRHERVERHDLALAVADDLRVGVSPQKQVRHERLPEYEGRHLRVRLVVQQHVQGVPDSLLLAAVLVVLVEVHRQPGDRLGQDAHAGVDRRHLHGGSLVHALAGGGASEEEAVGASGCGVSRLVA